MGIDRFRVQVKQAANHFELGRLIEQQANAFQSIWTWDSKARWDANNRTDQARADLCQRLHLETYRAASVALRHLLEFPEWMDGHVPDLPLCWISDHAQPIFPPLWRLLPPDVPAGSA
jgi:hypothetical protein